MNKFRELLANSQREQQMSKRLLRDVLRTTTPALPMAYQYQLPVSEVHSIWEKFGRSEKQRPGRPQEYYGNLSRAQQKTVVLLLALRLSIRHMSDIIGEPECKILMFLSEKHSWGIERCPGCDQPVPWVGFRSACVQCKIAERTIEDTEETL